MSNPICKHIISYADRKDAQPCPVCERDKLRDRLTKITGWNPLTDAFRSARGRGPGQWWPTTGGYPIVVCPECDSKIALTRFREPFPITCNDEVGTMVACRKCLWNTCDTRIIGWNEYLNQNA